jgi:AcrR family transcriptional regulator
MTNAKKHRPATSRKPKPVSAPAAKTAASGRQAPAAPTPYHHGALREALLAASERVLERDGLQGLTLRAAAREAGVSHAAPTHHFGDLAGLLSELAALGFRRYNAELSDAGSVPGTPVERGMSRAKRYVAYARAHPGMYSLMFRTEKLDMARPALHEAAEAAFAGLAGAIAARTQQPISKQSLTLEQAAEIVRAWSLIHGFTTLLLDGRLTDILARLPAGTDAETLLGAMLESAMRTPAG